MSGALQVRILIVCLFLPRAELADFKPELMQLAEQARHDGEFQILLGGRRIWT